MRSGCGAGTDVAKATVGIGARDGMATGAETGTETEAGADAWTAASVLPEGVSAKVLNFAERADAGDEFGWRGLLVMCRVVILDEEDEEDWSGDPRCCCCTDCICLIFNILLLSLWFRNECFVGKSRMG